MMSEQRIKVIEVGRRDLEILEDHPITNCPGILRILLYAWYTQMCQFP